MNNKMEVSVVIRNDPDSDEQCHYCGLCGNDVCDSPPPAVCERAIGELVIK